MSELLRIRLESEDAEDAKRDGRRRKRKGAVFERSVVNHLARRVSYVCRSSMSRGVADVVAINSDGLVYLIQCKTDRGNMPSAELRELCAVAAKVNATPLVASRPGIRFYAVADGGVLLPTRAPIDEP